MQRLAVGMIILGAVLTGAFLFLTPRSVVISPSSGGEGALSQSGNLPQLPEPEPPPAVSPTPQRAVSDLPPQPQLSNPPTVVKAIYSTGWSAGSSKKLKELIALIKDKNLNGIVVDIKDFSGYLAYNTEVPLAKEGGAESEPRILRPNAMLKELHDNGIYVIGRVSVFQDPVMAKARPDWAIKDKVKGGLWADRKGLNWIDPAGRDFWDYIVAVAQDALKRGFDEINFDYIRFPSDGDLEALEYPLFDEATPRREMIAAFFKHLRQKLPQAKISADLFGLAAVERSDLGIGQVIEDAYPYFDYICPMVYPSHYAPGFLGYKNPAQYPYEVVRYSMEQALTRLIAKSQEQMGSTTTPSVALAKIRPWLQVFDLGATYDAAMIQEQVRAVEEVLKGDSDTSFFSGYLFWDPKNIYQAL